MMFGSMRKETYQLVEKMERRIDLIHTALIVRDPGTSVSVDAYEGLRKQVIAGATSRQAHVAQLAEFDVALRRGASTEDLLALVTQWLDQAGVARIDDPSFREAFDSAVAPDAAAEVGTPAYVNAVTGQLIRQGRLRAREVPLESVDSPMGEDAAASVNSSDPGQLDDVPSSTPAAQKTEDD